MDNMAQNENVVSKEAVTLKKNQIVN